MATKKALKKTPKKVAKKAVKKSAKKAAKKGAHHHAGHDLRRAYEHLGRLEALQNSLSGQVVVDINSLIAIARTELGLNEAGTAADLLRACEHLAFGSLAETGKETKIGDDLQTGIDTDYEHLLERAVEHWDEQEEEPSNGITTIYEDTLAAAEAAYAKHAFRRALELIRGAEALSHVRLSQSQLEAPESRRRLKA